MLTPGKLLGSENRLRCLHCETAYPSPVLLIISSRPHWAGYVLGVSFFKFEPTSICHPWTYLPRTIDFVICVVVWVGSSVGSFLNVVAWRMPQGESINGRSHCPRCLTRLNATDNFPVFGWIALRAAVEPVVCRYLPAIRSWKLWSVFH